MVQVGLRILDIFSDKLPVRNPSIRGSVRALTGQCDVTVTSPRDFFFGEGTSPRTRPFRELSIVLSYQHFQNQLPNTMGTYSFRWVPDGYSLDNNYTSFECF